LNRARGALLAAGAALLLGCVASSDVMEKAPTEVPTAEADQATVCFLLPSNSLHGTRFQVWDRTHFLGLGLPASWFAAPCSPGKHLFLITAENRVAIEADLVAGKRYFVVLGTDRGWVRTRAVATPVCKGTELWDKVESIQQGLVRVAPIEAARQKWEEEHRADAAELVGWFSTAPDRAQYLEHMSADDGR
jgi:hypothetical protein